MADVIEGAPAPSTNTPLELREEGYSTARPPEPAKPINPHADAVLDGFVLIDDQVEAKQESTSGTTSAEPRGALSDAAVKVAAESLKKAIEKGDKDAVKFLLETMTAADKIRLEAQFNKLDEKTNLRFELSRKFKGDYAVLSGVLDRPDGQADDSARIDTAVYRLNKLSKDEKSAEAQSDALKYTQGSEFALAKNAFDKEDLANQRLLIEKQLRETLSLLSGKEIEALRQKYAAQGVNLDDLLLKNESVTKGTREAMALLLKGNDSTNRTPEVIAELAMIGLRNNNVEIFKEAFRTTKPEAPEMIEARRLFEQKGGRQLLGETFKGEKKTDALDHLEVGTLRLSTIVGRNLGNDLPVLSWLWGTDKESIQSAIDQAPESERKRYEKGKALAEKLNLNDKSSDQDWKKALESLNDDEKASLNDYRNIRRAFHKAGDDLQVAVYEDRLLRKGGSVIGKVGERDGRTYGILEAIDQMSQKDWERLKSDPAFKAELNAMLDRTLNGEDRKLAENLLNAKLDPKVGSFSESQKITHSSIKAGIETALGGLNVADGKIIDSIRNMSPIEISRYNSDPEFRKKVDAQVAEFAKSDASKLLSASLLKKVEAGLSPAEMTNAEKVLYYASQGPRPQAHEVLRAMNRAFQDDPDLLKRVNADPGLKKIFDQALERALYPALYSKHSFADIYLTGKVELPSLIQLTVSRGASEALSGIEIKRALYDDILNASPEERELLLITDKNDPRWKEAKKLQDQVNLFAQLNNEEKDLLRKGLEQGGRFYPEDELRAIALNKGGLSEAYKVLSGETSSLLGLDEIAESYQKKYGVTLKDDLFKSIKDEKERQLIEKVLSQPDGFHPEDILRAYALDKKLVDIRRLEAMMKSPYWNEDSIQKVRDSYNKAFNSDMMQDVLKNIPKDRQLEFTRLMSPIPRAQRQDLYDLREDELKHRSTFADPLLRSLVGTYSPEQRKLALDRFAQEINDFMGAVPEGRRNELVANYQDALSKYLRDKDALTDGVVTAGLTIITVGGVAAGGAPSFASIALLGSLGASYELAARQLVQGTDFDRSKFLEYVTSGFVNTSLGALTPTQLAAITGAGREAALATARSVALARGGAVLKEGGKEILERALTQQAERELLGLSAPLSDDALRALAQQVAASPSHTDEVYRLLRQSIPEESQKAGAKLLDGGLRQLKQVATETGANVIGAGGSGVVSGVLQWDANRSVGDNLAMVLSSGLQGSKDGFVFGLGFVGAAKTAQLGGYLIRTAGGELLYRAGATRARITSRAADGTITTRDVNPGDSVPITATDSIHPINDDFSKFNMTRETNGDFVRNGEKIGSTYRIADNGSITVSGPVADGTGLVGKKLNGSTIESVTYSSAGGRSYKMSDGSQVEFEGDTTAVSRFTDANGRTVEVNGRISFGTDGSIWERGSKVSGSHLEVTIDGKLHITGATPDSRVGKPLLGSEIESVVLGESYGHTEYRLKSGTVLADSPDGITITDVNNRVLKLPKGITFDGDSFRSNYHTIGSNPVFNADGSLTISGATSDSTVGRTVMGSRIESITIRSDGVEVAKLADGTTIEYEIKSNADSQSKVREIVDGSGRTIELSSSGLQFNRYGELSHDGVTLKGKIETNADGFVTVIPSESLSRLGGTVESQTILPDGRMIEKISNGSTLSYKGGKVVEINGKDVSAFDLRMGRDGTISENLRAWGKDVTVNADGTITIGDVAASGRKRGSQAVKSVTFDPSGTRVETLADGTKLTIGRNSGSYVDSILKIEQNGQTVEIKKGALGAYGDYIKAYEYPINEIKLNPDGTLSFPPSGSSGDLVGKEMIGSKVREATLSKDGQLALVLDNGWRLEHDATGAINKIVTADNQTIDLVKENLSVNGEGQIVRGRGSSSDVVLGNKIEVRDDGTITISGRDLNPLVGKNIAGSNVASISQSTSGEWIARLDDNRQIVLNRTGEIIRTIDASGKSTDLPRGLYVNNGGQIVRGRYERYQAGTMKFNDDGSVEFKDLYSKETTTVDSRGERTVRSEQGKVVRYDAQDRVTNIESIYGEKTELLYRDGDDQPYQIKFDQSTLTRQPDGTWLDQDGKLYARILDVGKSGNIQIWPPDTFRLNGDSRVVDTYVKNPDGSLRVFFKDGPAEEIVLPDSYKQPSRTEGIDALKARGDLVQQPDGTLVSSDGTGRKVIFDAKGTPVESTLPDGTTYRYKYAADGVTLESVEVSQNGRLQHQIRKSAEGPAFVKVKADGSTEPLTVDGKPVVHLEAQSDGSLTMLNSDYVGQRITPDGTIVSVNAIGREAVDAKYLSIERKRLETLRDKMFDNPERRERFNDMMKSFEERYEKMAKDLGMSPAERDAQFARVYQQLNKMLSASDAALPLAQRQLLAEQFLLEAAHPRTVSQGYFNTCNVTAEEQVRLITRSPADMAQMLADVATTGRFITAEGHIIDMRQMKGALTPTSEAATSLGTNFRGRNDFSDISNYGVNTGRNFLDQILQNTSVEIYWQTRTINPNGGGPVRPASTIYDVRAGIEEYHPGDLRYELGDPRGNSSTGEFIVDYRTTPPTRLRSIDYSEGVDPLTGRRVRIDSDGPANSPELGGEILVDIGKQITGRTDPVHYLRYDSTASYLGQLRTVSTEDELLTALKEMKAKKAFPLTVHVDASNLIASRVSDAPHVINVHNIIENPPGSGKWFVEYTNQWGAAEDRLLESWGTNPAHNRGPIPLDEFFALMNNNRNRS